MTDLYSNSLGDAQREMNLTPQERYLYQLHLYNLQNAPVHNDDGTTSTLRQMSFDQNGRTYNVPTVWGGAIHSPDEAIARANEQGIDRYPSYPNAQQAEARYGQMHHYLEQDTPEGISAEWPMAKLNQQRMHTHNAPTPMSSQAQAFVDYWRGGQGAHDVTEGTLGMLPGSGDYMAARDSVKLGNEAADALRQGNYGEAAKKYGWSTAMALGALPVFGAIPRGIKGVANYTTKAIDTLAEKAAMRGKKVDPKFITELMNNPQVTDYEKDVILRTLEANKLEHQFNIGPTNNEPYKVDLEQFVNEAKQNIIPYSATDVRKHASHGLDNILPNDVASYYRGKNGLRTTIYQQPYPHGLEESTHFPEAKGYAAHTRSFDAADGFDAEGNRIFTQIAHPEDRTRSRYLNQAVGEAIESGQDPYLFSIAERAAELTPPELRVRSGVDPEGTYGYNYLEQLQTRDFDQQRLSDLTPNELAQLHRTEDSDPIRYVTEIQSDLFQRKHNMHEIAKSLQGDESSKLRDQFDASSWYDQRVRQGSPEVTDPFLAGYLARMTGKDAANVKRSDVNVRGESETAHKDFRYFNDMSEEFAQQSQRMKNNWWRRIVREEARKTANEGIQTMRFPTGPTANKIEGWVPHSSSQSLVDLTDESINWSMRDQRGLAQQIQPKLSSDEAFAIMHREFDGINTYDDIRNADLKKLENEFIEGVEPDLQDLIPGLDYEDPKIDALIRMDQIKQPSSFSRQLNLAFEAFFYGGDYTQTYVNVIHDTFLKSLSAYTDVPLEKLRNLKLIDYVDPTSPQSKLTVNEALNIKGILDQTSIFSKDMFRNWNNLAKEDLRKLATKDGGDAYVREAIKGTRAKSLFDFYDKNLPKFLEKEFEGGMKKVTDPNGNSWWEVKLEKDRGKRPIMVPLVAGTVGAGAAATAAQQYQQDQR